MIKSGSPPEGLHEEEPAHAVARDRLVWVAALHKHGVARARGIGVYLCKVSCHELGYVSAVTPGMSDNLKDKIENAADKAKDVAENAGQRIKHGAEKVADKVKDGAEKVADKVKDGADKVEDKGRDLGKKVGG